MLQPEMNVVVTATRVPTPADEVLAPVVVIDRATIERSNAGDAAELLRFHAGLDIASNGGPGQPTAMFIRGAESNQALVLVDGIRINPGTIGLPGLQNIRPDMIERIEVVKGPRSALWGSDAIGGVVNVVTRRGSQDGWITEAGYGAYDTKRASLNGGVDLGQSAALDVGVSWTDSDGFPTRTTDDIDRGYENLSANVALRADVGAAEVTVRHWRTAGTSEYSDFFLTPVDQDFVTSTTAAEVRLPVGAGRRGPRLGQPPRGRDRAEPVAGLPRDRSRYARRPVRLEAVGGARARRRRDVFARDARAANRSARASSRTPTRSTSMCRTGSPSARISRCWRSATPITRRQVPRSRGTPSTATPSTPSARASTAWPAAASGRRTRRIASATAATPT